jgi:hypothetical protein
MKWCTISEVQNGWIVKTTPDYQCNTTDDRGFFVFTDIDKLSSWVAGHFAPPPRQAAQEANAV